MIRRLWHALAVGHSWRVVSSVFNLPDEYTRRCSVFQAVVHCEKEYRRHWGFTEVVENCRCGTFRRLRLVGNHSAVASAAELASLERMPRR